MNKDGDSDRFFAWLKDNGLMLCIHHKHSSECCGYLGRRVCGYDDVRPCQPVDAEETKRLLASYFDEQNTI
jgi:hypothetical protein